MTTSDPYQPQDRASYDQHDEHGNPRYSRHDRTEYDRSQYGRPGDEAYRPRPGYDPNVPWGAPSATLPAAVRPRRGGTAKPLLIGAGSGLVVAAVVLGVVAALPPSTVGRGSVQASGGTTLPTLPSQVPNGQFPGFGSGSGSGGTGGGSTGGSGTSGSSGSRTSATAAQEKGIVTINSVLKYVPAESAGTGMVLTAGGEILTNNHVINGATSITVTVVATGRQYRADVVGTAPTKDVAVLQLRNASGLTTATLDTDQQGAAVGDSITGVGNAGGTGSLLASAGKVTGLGKTITASDEQGTNPERLHGLIQINAPIIAGDSGGPLYDAAGEVVGMDTAASTSGNSTSGTSGAAVATTAYAIPIATATTIAAEIESGVQTTAIHIGYPGFLGVSTEDANGQGALIAGLLSGGPAAAAGITAGSVVTSVDGRTVSSAAGLKSALTGAKPGTKVTVDWTDAVGGTHSRSITLAVGPAD